MSRLRALSASAVLLGLFGALTLTGCSNSSTTATASASSAASSQASTAPSAAASAAASGSAVPSAAASADIAAEESPIPDNLTPAAFCLLTAPLHDPAARPSSTSQSEAALVLTAKRIIKGTQALGQAVQLKALTGKQVAEIQVTIAILLSLWQNPDLEKGTIDDMAKASGVDVQTLKAAQTPGFQKEAEQALSDLKKFCA